VHFLFQKRQIRSGQAGIERGKRTFVRGNAKTLRREDWSQSKKKTGATIDFNRNR
jgi:hypothetical protein